MTRKGPERPQHRLKTSLPSWRPRFSAGPALTEGGPSKEELLESFEEVFDGMNTALGTVASKPELMGFMLFGHCYAWERDSDARIRALHTAYPVRWVRWPDNAVDVMVFEEFTEGWSSRIDHKLQILSSREFEGQL